MDKKARKRRNAVLLTASAVILLSMGACPASGSIFDRDWMLQAVQDNNEPLGDGGRLFIPEIGIDVALYQVRFINLKNGLAGIGETAVRQLPMVEEYFPFVEEELPQEPDDPAVPEIPEINPEDASEAGKGAEDIQEEVRQDQTVSEDADLDETLSRKKKDNNGGDSQKEAQAQEDMEPATVFLEEETEGTTENIQESFEEESSEEETFVEDGTAQAICDAWDSAVLLLGMQGLENVIGDHAYQGFDAIQSAQPGMMAYIKTWEGIKPYTCVERFHGHNAGNYLTDEYWNRLEADWEDALCMYTCEDNWQNITVTLWQKVDVWV